MPENETIKSKPKSKPKQEKVAGKTVHNIQCKKCFKEHEFVVRDKTLKSLGKLVCTRCGEKL